MFEFIQGVLEEKSPHEVVVSANGVGYLLLVPISCYSKLPACGQHIRLYTSFIVREDSHRLFGFVDKADRALFDILKEISGIGPKTALSLIGHLDRIRLLDAVHAGNAALLSKVPGIGKKTAERLIVELKDKKMRSTSSVSLQVSLSDDEQLRFDAIAALTSLGYSSQNAEKAVDKVLKSDNEPCDLPLLISKSLQSV